MHTYKKYHTFVEEITIRNRMKNFFTLILVLVSFTLINAQGDPLISAATYASAEVEVGQTNTYTLSGRAFDGPINGSNAGEGFCIDIDFGNATAYELSPQSAASVSMASGTLSDWDITYSQVNGKDRLEICLVADLAENEYFEFSIETVAKTVTDPNIIGTVANIDLGEHPITAGDDDPNNNSQSTGYKVIAASPTPVELVSFDAVARDNVSVLTWETSSEVNNEGFYVERSKDGKRFESLGFVKGNGTTSVTNAYEFVDETPNEDNYYRLRQVDFDGSEDYSDIEFVRFNTNVSASVYPNPFVDRLTISTGAYTGSISVAVLDASGRLISNEVTNDRNKDLSDLKAGVYYLYVRNEEGVELLKEKVIKVK